MSNNRVRKPPGGDSSFNIFGVPQESNESVTAKNAKAQVAENHQPQMKTTDDIPKNVKSSEDSQDTNDHNKDKQLLQNDTKETENAVDRTLSTSSGDKETSCTKDSPSSPSTSSPSKHENQIQEQSMKNKPRAGYNPITGEAYGSPEVPKTENPQNPSQARVRQPPGGASSKLW